MKKFYILFVLGLMCTASMLAQNHCILWFRTR